MVSADSRVVDTGRERFVQAYERGRRVFSARRTSETSTYEAPSLPTSENEQNVSQVSRLLFRVVLTTHKQACSARTEGSPMK